MAEEKKNIVDRLWDWFSSVKMAIVLFALISLTSIVGTILEQNAEPEKNIEIIGKFVGTKLAPAAYSLFEAMGFMDMYRSWWFIALLCLISANIIICSLEKFPKTWKMVKMPLRPLGGEQFKSLGINKEFTLKGNPGGNMEKLTAAINSMGFKPLESGDGGDRQLYAQKGSFTRLGVYITHLSILVILLGAVIGILFGFSGFLNIPEGSNYAVAFSRNPVPREHMQERGYILNALLGTGGDFQAAAGRLGVDLPRLMSRVRTVGLEPLGFTIRCEDFDVAFYENTDTPKEFTSHLTVFEGNKKVMEKWIEVNSPLKYKGYTFYQSSYGPTSDPDQFRFMFRVRRPDGASEQVSVKRGEKFFIPGTGIEAFVSDFSPAIAFDQTSGRPFTYNEMMNNPAVRLAFKDGENESARWILKRYPETWALRDSVMGELVDIWGAQFTGLQVRKDPGVWIVYLGCLIMSIGLYTAFFMSHRKIWLKATGSGGSTKVMIAATSHKNREAFERKIDRAVSSLLSEGGK
jgi:cytochrome c biogenesis protein